MLLPVPPTARPDWLPAWATEQFFKDNAAGFGKAVPPTIIDGLTINMPGAPAASAVVCLVVIPSLLTGREIRSLEIVEDSSVVSVSLLKDTGADWNLVSSSFVASLNGILPLVPLSRPVPLRCVNGDTGKTVSHTIRLPLRLPNDHFSEEVFAIADLGIRQDIILGLPWLEKFCPEAISSLRKFGESLENLPTGNVVSLPAAADSSPIRGSQIESNPAVSGSTDSDTVFRFPASRDPSAAFSAGGVIAAIDAEIFRRQHATEIAACCASLRAAVDARLEEITAIQAMAASGNSEDAGVRGPTGNSEGWLDTIPAEFRRFAHTVFSDEAAAELPPHRPDHDCVIRVREGEKLATSKIYDMSQEQLTTLKALLDVELKKGFIRPSHSESSAPVFFVTDPPSQSRNKGQLRLVVDYRDLNRKIELDEYPIPLTRTVMARLPKAKIFTKFDVRSGFSNIRVAPGSEPATAFKTPFGWFEYQVMPMGLATAPSVFQRFINSVLAPFLDLFCFAYLDDIIIFSDSETEHRQHVTAILEALEKNRLHLKPAKCVWFTKEVSFLGYTAVAGKGIRMSDDKIAKITALAPPTNVHELPEALGLIQFYSGFIPHYSDHTAVLTRLTSKDVPWNWSPKCSDAWSRILAAIQKEVFLAAFDWEKPTILETDASDVAYGGVISQPDDDNKLRPVVIFHHKFKSHEKNWDIHDKELYAIVYAFDAFRHFLAQPRFPMTVVSDHRNLAKFMFSTDLLKSHDGRLGRWWQTLSAANFTIEYRPGEENVVADFLSRYQQNASEPEGLVLLPRHRFSDKAFADVNSWFKKSRADKNVRQILEDHGFGRGKKNHAAVSVQYCYRDQVETGEGQWYMDVHLLSYGSMKEALTGVILEELSQMTKLLWEPDEQGNRTPTKDNASQIVAQRDYLLQRIRAEATQIQKDLSRQKNKTQRRLEKKIKKLDNLTRTAREAKQFDALKTRLDALMEFKAKRQTLLSKAKWLEMGANNSADFWNLRKTVVEDCKIYGLQNENGSQEMIKKDIENNTRLLQ
ncbi:Similar to Retrotransposable element Tf2 155 kDa protein type 1; acc. no. Q05654 [Pyronema omphalodes CBS 100304]|uniref:RNA-directed DNA polymerase n=1 Tax=Pyronema omphalodes (strain CBS 100304) TaxID=1076935 RepID=U4LCC7_PYROM|nr:Similar to Retrotransposable element Tf2 155 kDa protein type 1; acc. no. Q05654 [Pyronema omphalodes CBS 100304]